MPNSAESYSELLATRHPSTREKMLWFEYGHLPEGKPRQTSTFFAGLAWQLIEILEDGPQFTICLDKLREAKDRAVSQAITDAKSKKNGNDDS